MNRPSEFRPLQCAADSADNHVCHPTTHRRRLRRIFEEVSIRPPVASTDRLLHSERSIFVVRNTARPPSNTKASRARDIQYALHLQPLSISCHHAAPAESATSSSLLKCCGLPQIDRLRRRADTTPASSAATPGSTESARQTANHDWRLSKSHVDRSPRRPQTSAAQSRRVAGIVVGREVSRLQLIMIALYPSSRSANDAWQQL
jgi:hypothetical protein